MRHDNLSLTVSWEIIRLLGIYFFLLVAFDHWFSFWLAWGALPALLSTSFCFMDRQIIT
jgi:hypothetical protein